MFVFFVFLFIYLFLLFCLPVHDESMGNDHSIQIVLVVSGDTEEVQLVALLIISDLQQSTAIAQNSSALRFGKEHSPETR